MHWDGNAWMMQASPISSTLWSVALSTPDNGWAVGDGGIILHFNGSDWITVTSPTTNTLRNVMMLSSLEGWAVGDNGTILHYSTAVDHQFLPLVFDQSRAALLMHLDEPVGATAFKNESGYGKDCTCVGATCPVAGVDGVVNTAAQFDGIDDYINLSNPSDMNRVGEITLEAWVKVEAADGIRNILAHGYTSNPQAEVFLRVQNGSYEVGAWDGQSHKAVYAIPAEDMGQWVHLVGTYDGIAWRLFRNGIEVSSAYDSTGAISVGGDWALGAHGSGTERFFKGALDQVSVYFRALSAQEVVNRSSDTRNLR